MKNIAEHALDYHQAVNSFFHLQHDTDLQPHLLSNDEWDAIFEICTKYQ